MVKDIESKRVNFSARTVITPDPTLSLNELGVPIAVAKNLTFPEITTPYNIEYLQKLVRNGRNKYPGANFVIKATNPDSPYDIRYTKNIELKYGDIVERHLINGDFVLFNRQPTLHKQSMMGHKIRVIDNPNLCTFRLNPMATTPYNADFDGDEMNMHAPQSIQAQIELEEIADVKLQLIKPQSSAPSVGMKQEFMLGAYNLSYDFTKIDWRTVMNIITSTNILELEKITKNKEYSGKELFSYIIPKNINMSIPNKINIKNGIMTEGIIDGASLGEGKPGNLVQLIWDEYGYEEAKNFMDNTTRMVNNFNLFYGFTVGIKDLDTSEEFRKQLYQTFNTKKLEVNHDITEAENNPDLTDETILEYTIKQKLDNIRDDVSNLIMKNLPANNNFKIMIDSGAKGKPLQMCQMAACVGQQDFMGARMPKNYNNRTLPYYHQHNDSAEARGFIQNSFYSGLNLPEFIFQSITSRSGLIDQAVKSVSYDTEIIIIENNKVLITKIGEWIDNKLNNSKDNIKHETPFNMELLEVSDNIKIPTCDHKGNVSWGSITAITRHDPNKIIYKVSTKSGRCVKVPESKSLLIWNESENQFVNTLTEQVKIGDFMPLTKYLPNINNDDNDNNDNNNKSLIIEDEETVREYVERYIKENGKENRIYFENENKVDEFNILLNRIGLYGIKDKNSIIISNEYKTVNDIVLDEIVSIEELDVKDYPKLYDLTVPETFNFQLFNGLNVVDTAQSGYIQRKLIKSVEDFMIKYDGTVRNAVDRIQQFIYGDSGVDTIKQHKYKFKLLEFSNKEMEEKYKLTKEELGKVKNYSEKDNEEYLRMMIENRDKLRMTQRKATLNYIVLDITYFIPVNIERIVNNAKNNEEIKGDIIYEPKYIIDFIENILKHENTQLICMSEDENKDVNSIKRKDEMISKTAFRIALYDLLAPKKCIFNYKFTKQHYDIISKHIINSFNKAIIQPGEMTGIIAAQSLGEPVTQMMLNSLDWIEEILIRDTKNDIDILKPIGEIIDDMIENNKDKVKEMGDNLENNMKQIYYLDITDKEYYIKSVDKYGKIEWKQITAITKHLPINKDGSNKLIKVITKNNKSVIATKGKSFLTMKDNLIVPIRGDEIQVNDYLPIDKNNIDNINDIESNNIIYPNINLKYIKGRISKYNLELIKDNLKDNKEDYEIINRIINSDVYWDQIVSIEEIEPSKTYVYDLTVEDNKTFIIRNGICCMDSFHSAGIAGKGGSNLGVGRLSEVLSLSKNPKQPMMIVYFDKENRFNKSYANKIASYIKLTMIKDIRNDIEIYYDPKPYEKGGIMESDNVYNVFHPMSQSSKTACSSSIDGLPWLLRITFDKEKLLKKEVSLLDIKSNLCLAWEKRYIDSKSMKREKKMVLDKITQMAILSNTDNDDVPTIHIRFDMMNFNSHTLIDFVDIYIDEFKLKGMLNITDVQGETATEERLIEFNEDGSLDKREEFVIYTEGINMNAIRKINGIDMNRTFCNDIITTFEIFGIEAARNLIIRDITNVMISNGSGVNFQHVSQFADLMTNMGTLTSIDRNGINKLDTDPFSRASFEKTVDQLITSAVFGEVDYMKSVSSRIMAGLCIKGGTGLCNVVIDNDLLKNSEYTTDIGQLYKNTFETITNNMNKLESEDNVFIPEI